MNKIGLQEEVWGSFEEILSKRTEWQSDPASSDLTETHVWRRRVIHNLKAREDIC